MCLLPPYARTRVNYSSSVVLLLRLVRPTRPQRAVSRKEVYKQKSHRIYVVEVFVDHHRSGGSPRASRDDAGADVPRFVYTLRIFILLQTPSPQKLLKGAYFNSNFNVIWAEANTRRVRWSDFKSAYVCAFYMPRLERARRRERAKLKKKEKKIAHIGSYEYFACLVRVRVSCQVSPSYLFKKKLALTMHFLGVGFFNSINVYSP